MNQWYKTLKRAPWSPPSYVFGIVWPVLYVLMGISFYITWNDKKCFPYCNALTFFLIQLSFNLVWTTIFFKYKMPKLALLDLIATLVFTIITYINVVHINRLASSLLLPYIVWMCLAFSLNLYIVIMN
jgi:benzodiazapine receptor